MGENVGVEKKDSGVKWGFKGKFFTIIFLVWFFASMGGLFYSSKIENCAEIVIALLGQYFLVFGILVVKASLNKPHFPILILILPIVGTVMLGCGLYMIVFDGEDVLALMEVCAPYILIWIFPISGAVMVIKSCCDHKYLTKHCTYEIQARCVEMDWEWRNSSHGGSRKYYTPIYEIYYGEKQMKICDYYYSDTANRKIEVGQYYTILINPNNPNEILDVRNKNGDISMLLVGVGFLLISLPIVCTIYKYGISI